MPTLTFTTELEPQEIREVITALETLAHGLSPSTIPKAEPEIEVEEEEEEIPDSTLFADTNVEVDEKGVAFDKAYCAKAKDPFFKTGKRAGQWKKARGVDDAVYDAWHASQAGSAPEPEVETNTAAAFGAAPTATVKPANAGQLVKWVGEKTAAGLLNQGVLEATYAELGFKMADAFADPLKVQALYNALVPVAGE